MLNQINHTHTIKILQCMVFQIQSLRLLNVMKVQAGSGVETAVLQVCLTTHPCVCSIKQEQITVWLCVSQVADQDTLSLAITKSWFEQLAPNPMELVVSVCRQPFTELRLAGLQVLRVLAEQQWGQENINSMPGECSCHP